MSRLEKRIHKKLKKRKINRILKFLFFLVMITNLSVCVFIIDKSAKDMLGVDAHILNSFNYDINIYNIKNNITKKVNKIYKQTENIINSYVK